MESMARPTSLTTERREVIERALGAGAPLRVAAASAGVSARTLSRWLAQGHVVRRELRVVPDASGEDSLPDDDVEIQRTLLSTVYRAAEAGDWRASAWLLAKRWPQRYGSR
jgi:hypothetical protein